jgi:hypothetical protein
MNATVMAETLDIAHFTEEPISPGWENLRENMSLIACTRCGQENPSEVGWSVVSCQLSVVSCQLSVVSCQLSVGNTTDN